MPGGCYAQQMTKSGNRSTSAAEDYLERIQELIDTKGYARVVDIAGSLGISQASVTNMVKRLDAEGFLHHEKYRGLVLTSEGEQIARAISRRHRILTDFFQLMEVSPAEVERDVEGMEHHLSSASLCVIEALYKELSENRQLLEKIKSSAASSLGSSLGKE